MKIKYGKAKLYFQLIATLMVISLIVFDFYSLIFAKGFLHFYDGIPSEIYQFKPFYQNRDDTLIGVLKGIFSDRSWCYRFASLIILNGFILYLTINSLRNLIKKQKVVRHELTVETFSHTENTQPLLRHCWLDIATSAIGLLMFLSIPIAIYYGERIQACAVAKSLLPFVDDLLSDWPPRSVERGYPGPVYIISSYHDPQTAYTRFDIKPNWPLTLPEHGVRFIRSKDASRLGILVLDYEINVMVFAYHDESARYGPRLLQCKTEDGKVLNIYVVDYGDDIPGRNGLMEVID